MKYDLKKTFNFGQLRRYKGLVLFLASVFLFAGCASKTSSSVQQKDLALIPQNYCLRVLWLKESGSMDKVREQMERGRDFISLARQMARKYPGKAYDHTYCLKAGQMDKSLLAKVGNLKPGEVVGPFEYQKGYVLIRATTDQYLLQAKKFMAKGELDSALVAIEKDLAVNYDHVSAWRFKGFIFMSQGKWQKALSSFDKALLWSAYDPGVLSDKAACLWRLGEKDKAIETYSKAAGLDPSNALLLNNLAWAMAQQGKNLDKALVYAKRAVTIAPYKATLWDTLGWIYQLKRDHAHAVIALQRALFLGKTTPETQNRLLMSFAALNRDQLLKLEHKSLLSPSPKNQKPFPLLTAKASNFQKNKSLSSKKTAKTNKKEGSKEDLFKSGEFLKATPPPWIMAKVKDPSLNTSDQTTGPKAQKKLNSPTKTTKKLKSKTKVSPKKAPQKKVQVKPKTVKSSPQKKVASVLKSDSSKLKSQEKILVKEKKQSKQILKSKKVAPDIAKDLKKTSETKDLQKAESLSEPKKATQKKTIESKPETEELGPLKDKGKYRVLAAVDDDYSVNPVQKAEPVKENEKKDEQKSKSLKSENKAVFSAKINHALPSEEGKAQRSLKLKVKSKEENPHYHGMFLQIASFRKLSDALTLKQKWQTRGQDCLLEHLDLGKRGKWYRVLMGPFKNREIARTHGIKLISQGQVKTFMVVEK